MRIYFALIIANECKMNTCVVFALLYCSIPVSCFPLYYDFVVFMLNCTQLTNHLSFYMPEANNGLF